MKDVGRYILSSHDHDDISVDFHSFYISSMYLKKEEEE
jgi:hypothetical protein